MFNCKILADSISNYGHRLTTFEITLPRIVLAEFNTHRMFGRNSASSRAIPVAKSIEAVENDPFIPAEFGRNQKGMVAGEALDEEQSARSLKVWLDAINDAIITADALRRLEVHKSLANRILEPYKWQTIIVTATDWDNFFTLRCNPEAQGEIRTIAEMMREQYGEHEPHLLKDDEWHLPLVDIEERINWDWETLKKISIGRCARVSYLTHDGKRDPAADVALHDRLLANGHMSPFEHVARPFTEREWDMVDAVRYALVKGAHWPDPAPSAFRFYMARQAAYAGHLHGWWSARMDVPHQHNFALALAAVKGDGEPDQLHDPASS